MWASQYAKLAKHIRELQSRFLQPFIPANPSVSALDFQFDVHAFCILSHAAFENYFEELALMIIKNLDLHISSNKIARRVPRALLALSLHGKEWDIGEDPTDTFSRRIKNHFEAEKRAISKLIYDNHGINVKHLRGLFDRLGVDLPTDDLLSDSLKKLCDLRGEFAHKMFISQVIAPEDAFDLSVDVLKYCKLVRDEAKKVCK